MAWKSIVKLANRNQLLDFLREIGTHIARRSLNFPQQFGAAIDDATASFIVGPKPDKKRTTDIAPLPYIAWMGIARFMGTVGVPDRYPLPKVEQVVEVRYLYCQPGPDGKLIQAKYFGKVRDDINLDECSVSQLKVKANDGEPTES
jgi:hypothetical protein